MNDAASERLAPFLNRKGARQKLILYLIADGYTVTELVVMKTTTFKKLELPQDMAVYRDQVLDEGKFEMAFTYPGGGHIPPTMYYRLIRETAQKVLGRPMSQGLFRKYITTGS